MKKQLISLLMAASVLPGNAILEAKQPGESGCTLAGQIRDQSLRKTFEKYAREYDNLRPVKGQCPSDYKLVQIALLLDTSNSMDGLISQAKSQLWRIVNEVSRMRKRGEPIRLQVALYEYGNNSFSPGSGYIRQVVPFTEDLDLLSETLFSLTTNGGSEYCGHVIGSSLNQLKWNTSRDGLRLIYIAGNEPFDQGDVSYEATCRWAVERDIVVNTIFCGDYYAGVQGLWKKGAAVGRGSYFAIDSDERTPGIITPYDDELMRLNGRLNDTYVPYGEQGKARQARQSIQDRNAAAMSAPVAAERAATKGSFLYKASGWDLVDAIDNKTVTVEGLKKESLPDELKSKSDKEIGRYVQQKKEERESLKMQITEINRQRDTFVQERERERSDSKSLGSVILEDLRTQATRKHFGFR
jgi:hypothetical protein